jgi:hypothetical protein
MIVVSGIAVSRLRPPLAPLATAAALFAGLLVALGGAPALAQQPGQGAQKAMFATKAEAEAAAKHFNCTGAHKMGNQWMPCASHGETKGGSSGHGSH